jgi:hypothetical protein
MKAIIAFIVGIFVVASGHSEEKVNVPKGVKYKSASREVNDQATDRIQKVFKESATDEDTRVLLDKHLICGPALWRKMKTDPKLKDLTNGVMEIQMPIVKNGKVVKTQQAEGKLFQGADEVSAFWSVFKARYRFDNSHIRKPNALELRIFWVTMIPFKAIEEPVFVVETGDATILVQLNKSKLTLFWIDDYKGVGFEDDKPAKKSRS